MVNSNENLIELCSLNNITWFEHNLAYGCEFPGNDIYNLKSSGEECGIICDKIRNCTHYTWKPVEGGICFLKNGNISTNDAKVTNDLGILCGLTNVRDKLNLKKKCSSPKNQPNSENNEIDKTILCELESISWYENSEYGYGCEFSGNDLLMRQTGGIYGNKEAEKKVN
jgi:hypothetical protein